MVNKLYCISIFNAKKLVKEYSSGGIIFNIYMFCTAECETFIEPPPDTQRTERQGERGIWVAMGCYLLQATPFSTSPTSPLPNTVQVMLYGQ
jgi:hypothetical protein